MLCRWRYIALPSTCTGAQWLVASLERQVRACNPLMTRNNIFVSYDASSIIKRVRSVFVRKHYKWFSIFFDCIAQQLLQRFCAIMRPSLCVSTQLPTLKKKWKSKRKGRQIAQTVKTRLQPGKLRNRRNRSTLGTKHRHRHTPPPKRPNAKRSQ